MNNYSLILISEHGLILAKAQVNIWDLGIKQQSGAGSPELAVTKEKSAFSFIAIGEVS
ncbi:hypothetical protein [Nostoc sp.]|uniref:hypothetical protein n=1 Tax=Nostoc sp. TaxID=1180 RepID=UPI002FEEC490